MTHLLLLEKIVPIGIKFIVYRDMKADDNVGKKRTSR